MSTLRSPPAGYGTRRSRPGSPKPQTALLLPGMDSGGCRLGFAGALIAGSVAIVVLATGSTVGRSALLTWGQMRMRGERSARTRVPSLMHELQAVAVKVGDVGGVVAGREVGSVGGLTFVGTTCFDGGGVRSIHSFVAVTHQAQVEAGLARLALTEPDA